MPLLNSLATPYAEALLQVTEARSESETVADQCKQLLDVWQNSADFRDAMVSPYVHKIHVFYIFVRRRFLERPCKM